MAAIKVDPNDPQAIYYGTVNKGLLYTFDRGKSWQVAKNLAMTTIKAIEVDPLKTCTVYAAVGRKIFKTENCSRSWKMMFTDNSSSVTVEAIKVDHFNSDRIIAALSRGDVIQSTDAGKSWQTIHRFGQEIQDFIMDPNDSRLMYAKVDGKRFMVSADGANTWQKLGIDAAEFKIGAVGRLQLFKGYPDLMYMSTQKGIIKSTDKGKNWEALKLLPPKDEAGVISYTVNPANANEVYYVTTKTFYKSVDGGENWITKKMPTTKKPKRIFLDQEKDNILYLGLQAPPQK